MKNVELITFGNIVMSITSFYQRLLVVLAVLVVSAGIAYFATDSASAQANHRAIAVTGITDVDGEAVIVHIIASLEAGKSDQEIAEAALRGVNARGLTASEYTLLENSWDQFSDGDPGNDFVSQRYNSDNEAAGAQAAIETARGTWNAVDSPFAFESGMGVSTICPSLVDECKGAQTFDGFNDIGWVRLRDRNTLAVAWSGTTIDESDVAFNIRHSWSTDEAGSGIDIETVALHELGHVAGIGHSEVGGSIMEAVYAGVRRVLTGDDIAALQALYGTGDGTTPTPTPTPDPGATPPPVPTSTPVPPVGDELHVGAAGYADGDGVTYSLSGRKGRDLIITVHITDGSSDVEGASVNITATNTDTGWSGSATGSTNSEGEARFRVRNADSGSWSTTVNSASAGSLSCDADCPDGPHSGVK